MPPFICGQMRAILLCWYSLILVFILIFSFPLLYGLLCSARKTIPHNRVSIWIVEIHTHTDQLPCVCNVSSWVICFWFILRTFRFSAKLLIMFARRFTACSGSLAALESVCAVTNGTQAEPPLWWGASVFAKTSLATAVRVSLLGVAVSAYWLLFALISWFPEGTWKCYS